MKKMLVLFCCLFLCGSCASFGKTTKPAQEPLLNEYAEQVLDEFQHFGWNRNLYGKEISYLGQTETVEGYHQIYIHSTPKMTLNEQRDNMMSIEAYTCEFIALRVNETEESGLEWSSACMEQWSYQLTGVNIQSIYFDQSNVYVSTGKGPVWKYYEGDYNVFCFEKETGKQIWKQVVPGPVVTSFYTWNDSLMFSVFEYSGSQMVEIDSRDGSILGTYNNVMEGVQVDDAVYFTSLNIEEEPILEKYSLKTKKSEIVWNGENNSSPRESYNSFVTSPVHVQDWLCYATFLYQQDKPSQSFLYAYNTKTNSIDWSMELGSEVRLKKIVFDGTYLYTLQYGAFCMAIDPFTQTEKWQTTFEGYLSNQVVPYKDRVYMVISKLKWIAKWGVGYSFKALYLNRETGELETVAPPSYFTGIGGIVGILKGQYRDYLITQGPNRTYLGLYSITE